MDKDDPRVIRSRTRAIETAAKLLEEEGATAVTHKRVAEDSGIGRATLYRHWPKRFDLVFDTLAAIDNPLFRAGDPTFSLDEWLTSELVRMGEGFELAVAAEVTAAIVTGQHRDRAAAEFRDDVLQRSAAPLHAAIQQAVDSGELREAPDVLEILDMTAGPVLFRQMIAGRAVTREFAERLTQAALNPYR